MDHSRLSSELESSLKLPEKMAGVHNVFHVSYLRKYMHDPTMVVSADSCEDLEVDPVVSRPRKPLRIVETDTKQLRRKTITLLKVQWSDDVNDCTWEEEERMKAAHPELFKV